MSNAWKSIFILIFIIFFQFLIYMVFLRPIIFSWGASESEMQMPMAGDELAPYISSTRAITINAPPDEVWNWLTQLGADRGGFFSYDFIEKALGYETNDVDKELNKDYDMKVGRIIPGSLDDDKSIIKYNFPVVYVEPGKTFVLKNWGTFAVNKIDDQKTRLIVRTHGQSSPNLKSKIAEFFILPLHYLMERRMLLGIKERAEAGHNYQLTFWADFLWFLGIFLSTIGITLMIFIGRGMIGTLLSSLYGLLWLLPLLIFDPKPTYGLGLLLLVTVTILYFLMRKRTVLE